MTFPYIFFLFFWRGMGVLCTSFVFQNYCYYGSRSKGEFLKFLSFCAVIVYHVLQWTLCCSLGLSSTKGKTH